MNNVNQEGYIRRFSNFLVVLFLKGVSYLPFFILYGISDFMYFFIKNVIRYRRKVITENLRNSFPEKSEKEIARIRRKFYSHFCDMLLEGLKAYSISKNSLEKRIVFKNLDLFDKYYNEGKSVINLGMHYNTWEWSSLMTDKVKFEYLVIYSPVKGNQAFENFLRKSRERYSARLIPRDFSTRAVIEFSKLEKPQLIGLVADQSPPPNTKSWIRFLNQETGFFSGPEKIAFRTKQPIVFEHAKKVGRGRYEVYHYPIFENYDGVEPKDILIKYARKMEEIISEKPEYYLWSHRRWKRKRPENVPLTES
jgi:Kdo2-lipid IVA lauroyltransferase/acyltransferase